MIGSNACAVARMADRARWQRQARDWRVLLRDWSFWADRRQQPPPGDWRVWLLMAGRGFGKTRAGAEWVRMLAETEGAMRIALVGATRAEARAVMIEGDSGVLAVSPAATRPRWEPSRGVLTWRSGAKAFVYSGESPDGLRGPQHHVAWCDEIAKWAYPQATWDMLAMSLRLGEAPRALVTTTPRPIALLKALVAAPDTVTVRGRTADNLLLPAAFRAAMAAEYGGTRLGRQELDGELIEDVPGALWRRDAIERCRAMRAPELERVVIGVDPPAGTGGDACGIVAVGLGRDRRGYVLDDASVAGASPEGWARAVARAAARWRADRVIAEANQGGSMVKSVLHAADCALPVTLVHATRGKSARAEPVAALYEAGRVRHVGAFAALEDEMCGLIAGGGYEGPGRSPVRADALVWAMSELMLGRRGDRARAPPSIRSRCRRCCRPARPRRWPKRS
jgi:phage terminase large subunit-like protein